MTDIKPLHKFKKGMKIAVDFDGTLCEHKFPNIGLPIGAFPVLKLLQKAGARIILDTMRSGDVLLQAVQWCNENGIVFYSIGKDKGQEYWTKSTKCNADISIDDRNLGVPLIATRAVDWVALMHSLFSFFIENGITREEWNETMIQVKTEQNKFIETIKE